MNSSFVIHSCVAKNLVCCLLAPKDQEIITFFHSIVAKAHILHVSSEERPWHRNKYLSVSFEEI